jgi:hypothetical protein
MEYSTGRLHIIAWFSEASIGRIGSTDENTLGSCSHVERDGECRLRSVDVGVVENRSHIDSSQAPVQLDHPLLGHAGE